MSWAPPESVEEKAKRLLVPPGYYIRQLYGKKLKRGEREISLVPFLSSPRRTSLDIGANKGVYAYAMLKCSARVHAFEPNPKLFRILQGWARGRVELHEIALSDRSGTADLYIPRSARGYSNQGGSLTRVKVSGNYGTVRVAAARLDDLDIRDVGFMKIDVEGFEVQVLEGASATLARDRPNLLIEIEEKHTRRPLAEVVRDVCAHGYQCLALVQGRLTPFGRLDLDRHHTAPRTAEDYVYNFVFLPS